MNRILLLFCMGIGAACIAQPAEGDLSQFDWLAGKWKRTGMSPGKEAYEVWVKGEDQLMGQGISMKDGDTTFVEKLRIKQMEGEIYYVADVPQNPEPTLFKVTEIREGYFRCTNPQHDFPKEITYELKEEQLTATISGDGKSIPFVFTRRK